MKWRELIFCLLEVHSLGLGRSLAHSLGCHAEGSLSHPTPHYRHPLNPPLVRSLPLSLYLARSLSALSAWRLPLLQLTLVLPLLGEMRAELLTPGLIFLLFPISFISSSWRHWKRQRMGGGMRIKGWGRRPEWKGEEGEYCQLTSPLQTNNVWCSGGIENTKLTVLLVVGARQFRSIVAYGYNTTPKTTFPNATNSSCFS